MYFVYILKSEKHGRHYIGHSDNVEDRLLRHNRGAVKVTKSGKPWQIIYKEACVSRSDAYRREFEIKSYKSGVQFRALLAKS